MGRLVWEAARGVRGLPEPDLGKELSGLLPCSGGLQQNGRQPLQLFVAGIDLESAGLQGGNAEQGFGPFLPEDDCPADDFTLEPDLCYGYVQGGGFPSASTYSRRPLGSSPIASRCTLGTSVSKAPVSTRNFPVRLRCRSAGLRMVTSTQVAPMVVSFGDSGMGLGSRPFCFRKYCACHSFTLQGQCPQQPRAASPTAALPAPPAAARFPRRCRRRSSGSPAGGAR